MRHCHYCGHALATYRGILLNEKQPNERFFCNAEHLKSYADTHPKENLPMIND
ncbi:hypothetical protein AO377_0333 [Moraxella catarrhalis]|nr:hypothetical protein AO377_0333 [Moraxella catarrhalis]